MKPRFFRNFSNFSFIMIFSGVYGCNFLPSFQEYYPTSRNQNYSLTETAFSNTPTYSTVTAQLTPISTTVLATETIINNPNLFSFHNLFYLGYDNSSDNFQIFNLDLESNFLTQITNDSKGVLTFDVLQKDGRIAYINNDYCLVLLDIMGNNPIIIENNITPSGIPPIWSLDGKIIAYYNNGITFFYPETKSTVFPDINHSYSLALSPRQFSPDSTMLIFHMGDKFGIFNLDSEKATLLSTPSNNMPYSCCAPVYWSSDSSHIYIADYEMGGSGEGMRLPGLWRYTIDGLGIDLLPVRNIPDKNTSFTKVIAPWEDIYNNFLYFLSSQQEIGVYDPSISFSLTRMVLDATTDRVTLHNEVFTISSPYQVIWSLDGSFILIMENKITDSMTSIFLVPTNPDLPIRKLVDNAHLIIGNFRWGPN